MSGSWCQLHFPHKLITLWCATGPAGHSEVQPLREHILRLSRSPAPPTGAVGAQLASPPITSATYGGGGSTSRDSPRSPAPPTGAVGAYLATPPITRATYGRGNEPQELLYAGTVSLGNDCHLYYCHLLIIKMFSNFSDFFLSFRELFPS